MIDQSSIQYISELLDHPGELTGADKARVDAMIQSYPYFTPGRYLAARDQFNTTGFAPGLLSSSRPYMGNWLLFCNLMQSSAKKGSEKVKKKVQEAPVEKVEEAPVKKAEEAPVKVPVEQAATSEQVPAQQPEIQPVQEPEPQQVIQAEVMSDDSVEIISEIEEEQLILPVYTDDYFLQQGIKVSEEIPEEIEDLKDKEKEDSEKSLMVMMSFSEWLLHFKSTSQKQKEEQDDRKALKTMWQKEKLAAAIEEENEEIPEEVFEMAVNSITKEEDLASESLAEIYIKQGKYDKAIEMYRKLSLRNPQKNTYFARKIEEVLKEKQS